MGFPQNHILKLLPQNLVILKKSRLHLNGLPGSREGQLSIRKSCHFLLSFHKTERSKTSSTGIQTCEIKFWRKLFCTSLYAPIYAPSFLCWDVRQLCRWIKLVSSFVANCLSSKSQTSIASALFIHTACFFCLWYEDIQRLDWHDIHSRYGSSGLPERQRMRWQYVRPAASPPWKQNGQLHNLHHLHFVE